MKASVVRCPINDEYLATVSAEEITTRELMLRAASMTVKHDLKKISCGKMYRSEHSPSRARIFWVEMWHIPTFVSVHLVRHKIGVEHFVESNRDDRGGSGADRWTPVNHGMVVNAQALINMSHVRLCSKASKETRSVFEAVKRSISFLDDELSECMVRKCVYRGGICDEFGNCEFRKVQK